MQTFFKSLFGCLNFQIICESFLWTSYFEPFKLSTLPNIDLLLLFWISEECSHLHWSFQLDQPNWLLTRSIWVHIGSAYFVQMNTLFRTLFLSIKQSEMLLFLFWPSHYFTCVCFFPSLYHIWTMHPNERWQVALCHSFRGCHMHTKLIAFA